MTRAQAKSILDAVQAGAAVDERIVNAALRVTGDLEPIEWPLAGEKKSPLLYREAA